MRPWVGRQGKSRPHCVDQTSDQRQKRNFRADHAIAPASVNPIAIIMGGERLKMI
jgi:hypothetical protein